MESDADDILTAEQFLAKYPNRPYTSMRTLNGQVVLCDEHLQRLAESAKLMGIAINDSDFAQLQQQLYQIAAEAKRSDVKIVVVYGQDGFRIKMEELPKPKIDCNGGCTVKVVRTRRNMPRAKSTEWVLQRRLLVHPNNVDIEEYVIEDDGGNMLEGFSSNLIFITKDGDILSTDKSLILQGTILGVVEKIFAVKFGLINNLDDVKAMAICSTSRLVLPVNRIIHRGKVIELNSSGCRELQAIRSKVEEWLTTA